MGPYFWFGATGTQEVEMVATVFRPDTEKLLNNAKILSGNQTFEWSNF